MEGLMFLTLCTIVGAGVFNVINESKENEKSEVLKEKVYVKNKKDNIYVDGNGILNKTFQIIFAKGKEEIECVIGEKSYKNIPENINGILTYKGTSFMKFEFDDKIIEN